MQNETNANKENHIEEIRQYIEVVCKTDDMHGVIVEGQAGWGKTTAVEEALELIDRESVHLGSYSTPLYLYNFLSQYSDAIILLDDCAGIFNDKIAMAILKAAMWPSRKKQRIVKWGSASGLPDQTVFDFTGKLILVCNSFPNTADGEAIRSRCYSRRLDISPEEAKRMLLDGAMEKRFFPKTDLAVEVSKFLVEKINSTNLTDISFRTLKKGYHLAEFHPTAWKNLFEKTLPKPEEVDPIKLIKELAKRNMKVKDQAKLFQQQTGLKERSFYNYRKQIGAKWKLKID